MGRGASGEARGEPLTGRIADAERLASSPDGHRLAGGGAIILWDLTAHQPHGDLLGGRDVVELRLQPDGQTLAAGFGGAPHEVAIELWDLTVQSAVPGLCAGQPQPQPTEWRRYFGDERTDAPARICGWLRRPSTFGASTATLSAADVPEFLSASDDVLLLPFPASATKEGRTVSEQPTDGRDEVEVAHEALIRHWPRLRGWLDADRAGLLLRESIREAAQDWERSGGDESYLEHRGRRLEDAEAMAAQARFALNAQERAYLEACLALRERERAAERRAREARERLRRRIAIGLAGFSLLALALAAVAWFQRGEAEEQRSAAVAQSTQAAAAAGTAEAERARAVTERARADVQAKIALARALAAEARRQRGLGQHELGALLAGQAYLANQAAGNQALDQVDDALRGALGVAPFSNVLVAPAGGFGGVAVSADGSKLVSTSSDGPMRLYDLEQPLAAPSRCALRWGAAIPCIWPG